MQQSEDFNSFFRRSLEEILKHIINAPDCLSLQNNKELLVQEFVYKTDFENNVPHFDKLEQFYHHLDESQHLHLPFVASDIIHRTSHKLQTLSMGLAKEFNYADFYSTEDHRSPLFFYDIRRFDDNYPLFFRSDIWEDFDNNFDIYLPLFTIVKSPVSVKLIFQCQPEQLAHNQYRQDLNFFFNAILNFDHDKKEKPSETPSSFLKNPDDNYLNWERDLENAQKDFFESQKGDKFVFAKTISNNVPEGVSILKLWLHEISTNCRLRLEESSHHSFIIIANDKSAFYSKTPEKLFSLTQQTLHLEALAGTIAKDLDSQKNALKKQQLLNDPKEKNEHQVVIDYFINSFKDSKMSVGKTEILELNKIQHLYTPLALPVKDLKISDINKLLKKLHPSPAVCGSPKEAAYLIIQKYENMDRGLFAGAITFGTWDFQNTVNSSVISLVTIRAQLLKDKIYHLFAGAGIMPESSAKQEWTEINKKLESFSSLDLL